MPSVIKCVSPDRVSFASRQSLPNPWGMRQRLGPRPDVPKPLAEVWRQPAHGDCIGQAALQRFWQNDVTSLTADHSAGGEDDDRGVVVEVVGMSFSHGVFDRAQRRGRGVVVSLDDRASDGGQADAAGLVGQAV